jgi:Asparagine synthase
VADLILECVREGPKDHLHTRDQFLRVAARLAPGDIVAHPPRLIERQGLRATVANPSAEGVRVAEGGVLLGGVVGETGDWCTIGATPPDGAYVLVRFSDESVELLNDMTASRALWYAHDGDRLIVSTSQRAAVALLGDLDVDRAAVSWLLSSGTLGPECSWDKRVRRLPPDSRLTLDRRAWRLDLDRDPLGFEPVARSREQHLKLLRDAVAWSCEALAIDTDRWLLPLSGGLDSRVILAFMLHGGRRPRCVTWTTRASLRNPLSDAFIARLVARRFRVEHEYVFLDEAPRDGAAALQRFIEVGEGGTDEFAAYVDGCAMWSGFFAEGLCGIIRGDEPLGVRRRAASFVSARRDGVGGMVADYPADHLVRRLGLADQSLPEWIEPRSAEDAEAYRDRMSHEGYIPSGLAPLTAIKCRYVEVVNPLLSRRLVALARTFPDELRMYGRALSAIVGPESRTIPHARFTSTPSASVYLADEQIVRCIVAELTSSAVEHVMSEEAALTLLAALASPSHTPATVRSRTVAAMKVLRVALPSGLAYRLTPRYRGPDPLTAVSLAFRATIASKAVTLLREDANALRRDRA